jgi:hypothetical protein
MQTTGLKSNQKVFFYKTIKFMHMYCNYEKVQISKSETKKLSYLCCLKVPKCVIFD